MLSSYPGFVRVTYHTGPDPSVCFPGHPTSLTCTDATISNSLTCQSHASLQTGLCLCDAGWRPSPDSSLCLPCLLANCANNCAGYFAGALVAGGLAVGLCICVPSYFPTPDTAHCTGCASACQTCFGPTPSHCTGCYPHARLSESLTSYCVRSFLLAQPSSRLLPVMSLHLP